MTDAIAELGQLMGLGELDSAGFDRVNTLHWPDGSQLDIETVEEELVLSLAFPAPHLQPTELLMALQMVDLRRATRTDPLQVGLLGQGNETRLVLATRVNARAANGHLLQKEVDRFRDWRSRWEAACKRDGQP